MGAVLYAALTGRRPFDRGDPTATLMAVLTQEPVRPRALEASIPEALELVIQRAMARQADNRHATMMQLDANFAPYNPAAGGLSLEDRISGPPARPWPSWRAAARRSRSALARHRASEAVDRAVLGGGRGLFWAAAGLVLAVGAVLRFVHGGGAADDLTLTESVLLVIAVAMGLADAGRPRRAAPRREGLGQHGARRRRRGGCAVPCCSRSRRTGYASRLPSAASSRCCCGARSASRRPGWDLVLLVIGAVAAAAAAVVAELEGRRA